jgi:hypothetical protein
MQPGDRRRRFPRRNSAILLGIPSLSTRCRAQRALQLARRIRTRRCASEPAYVYFSSVRASVARVLRTDPPVAVVLC